VGNFVQVSQTIDRRVVLQTNGHAKF